jgi:hypothetical protein
VSDDPSDLSDLDKARAEIAQTRAALAQTTAALAEKADVKTRATHAVKQNQAVVAAAAGAVALLLALKVYSGRRRKSKRR